MIENLIKPESIAVIGASAHHEKIGYQIFHNIFKGGYKGQVFAVNPKGGEILGKKVYKSLCELPVSPDLAIIVIPSQFVKEAVAECASNKVKAVIVISAGFSEIGENGKKLEEEIGEICRVNNITLLGPNCLGLINTRTKLNATFAGTMPKPGHVSFISQSGAIISSMIDWSKTASVGFNKVFSLGNKALISEADIMEYLYDDPDTHVVIGYLEQLTVSDKLTEVLIANSRKKPTILLFGGKSSFGARAAASHTGSIVSSYLAIKTYLEQAGVIMADDMEDLILYSRVFSSYREPAGKKIALVTNAGGPSIAASDSLFNYKLELAKLSEETISKLKARFRKEAITKNPVDILGDASDADYQDAIKLVDSDENVDQIIVLLTPQSSTKVEETARVIAKYHGKKPLYASFVGGEILTEAKEIIEAAGKPCFSFPEDAVRAAKVLSDFSFRHISLKPVNKSHAIFNLAKKYIYLREYDLPALDYVQTDTFNGVTKFAKEHGFPLVLKTADPEIIHKSDAGGVKLNLANEKELKDAFDSLAKPVIVGRMIKGKHEIFLGAKKDPGVGTVIAFGSGGIFAEILNDFSYAVVPVELGLAKKMISETKIGKILDGARGQRKYNLDQLAKMIVNLSDFIEYYSNIKEIDLNPVIIDDIGYHVVDARIILG